MNIVCVTVNIMAGNDHLLYNPYRKGMCMEISLLLISMHKLPSVSFPTLHPPPLFVGWVEGQGTRLKLPYAETRLCSNEGLLRLVQHFSSDPQTCTVATIIHNVVLHGLPPHSQAPLPSFCNKSWGVEPGMKLVCSQLEHNVFVDWILKLF